MTQGHKGNLPCPICLLPKVSIASGKLAMHCTTAVWPMFDSAGISKSKLKEEGQCHGTNAFIKIVSNVHAIIAADILHQVHLGTTAQVLGNFFKAISQHTKGAKAVAATAEAKAAAAAAVLAASNSTDQVTTAMESTAHHAKPKATANADILAGDKLNMATQAEFFHCTGKDVPHYHAFPYCSLLPYKPMGGKIKAYRVAGLMDVIVPALNALIVYNSAGGLIDHGNICLEMITSYVCFYKFVMARIPTMSILDKLNKVLTTFLAKYAKLHKLLDPEDEEFKRKLHVLTHYHPNIEKFGLLNFQSTNCGKHKHLATVKPAADGNNQGSMASTLWKKTLTRFAHVQHLLTDPAAQFLTGSTYQFDIKLLTHEMTTDKHLSFHESLPDMVHNIGHNIVKLELSKWLKLSVNSPFSLELVHQHMVAEYKATGTPTATNATCADGLLFLEMDTGAEWLKAGFFPGMPPWD
ncbi:hypothetical protein BC828DRAFT_420621 [Blastocladiella britannica]|nr:hypothetical protein BC828DRAFT_420621 [Blastocladiella britannica]